MTEQMSHYMELPSWDATYAANTGHHRVHDAEFLAPLPLRPTDRVLDLGCGSGDFTRAVADLVPDGHVVGLDGSAALLDEARLVAGPNQSFVHAAFQRLDDVLGGQSFDVVFSRSALHWVPADDQLGVRRSIGRLVRPGGWVRLEFGGAGNIPEILPLMDSVSASLGGPQTPWCFHDASTELLLLERSGLTVDDGHVRTVAQRRAFTREGLLGWFDSQVAQAYEVGLAPADRPRFRAAVEAQLEAARRWDASFDQTFVRVDVLARRPV
jgi:ubiquinone/menaquinone biosynthesis C-methylase UbiE